MDRLQLQSSGHCKLIMFYIDVLTKTKSVKHIWSGSVPNQDQKVKSQIIFSNDAWNFNQER